MLQWTSHTWRRKFAAFMVAANMVILNVWAGVEVSQKHASAARDLYHSVRYNIKIQDTRYKSLYWCLIQLQTSALMPIKSYKNNQQKLQEPIHYMLNNRYRHHSHLCTYVISLSLSLTHTHTHTHSIIKSYSHLFKYTLTYMFLGWFQVGQVQVGRFVRFWVTELLLVAILRLISKPLKMNLLMA